MIKFTDFFNIFKLAEAFTFYGGGGKGGGESSSSSQPVDFFGRGKRAPYEQMLSDLLLGTDTGLYGGYTVTVPKYDKRGRLQKGKGQEVTVGQVGLSDFIQSQPGYLFGYETGLDALNRQFAATGQTVGGGQLAALQDFGNKYAGQYYQQFLTNLMGPSGANMNAGQTSQSQSTNASPLWGVAGNVAGLYAGKQFGLF